MSEKLQAEDKGIVTTMCLKEVYRQASEPKNRNADDRRDMCLDVYSSTAVSLVFAQHKFLCTFFHTPSCSVTMIGCGCTTCVTFEGGGRFPPKEKTD